MRKGFELSYDELARDLNLKALEFKSTEDLDAYGKLIGQEKAEDSMEFGLNVRQKGYNIYISGSSGCGKSYYAREILERTARDLNVPDDWCYVYNFENEYQPIAINFHHGVGRIYKQDMEFVIDEIINKVPSAFSSEEYERQKNEILEDYHEIKNYRIDELSECAEKNNLQVKTTSTGFSFVPVMGGVPMSESEYDAIDRNEREEILKRIGEVRIKALDILRKLKAAEKEAAEKVKSLDSEIGLYVVESIIAGVKHKYSYNKKAVKHMELLRGDVLKNLYKFIEGIDKRSLNREEEELLSRYKVNLVVDNSETRGAPVIIEDNPTYNNLIGNIEYESKLGTITTDFLLIRAGSTLKANGGFLVVYAKDLLKNYQSWEGLKRIIKSGELRSEGIRSQLDLLTIASIKPEPINVNVKIILIGTEYLYQLLYEFDEEFCDLFKVKVHFDMDMERNDDIIRKTACFLGCHCRKNNIRHLDNSAVDAVIKYSSRLAGSKKRLSACLESIIDIVNESNIWAGISGNKYISRSDILKTIEEKKKRVSLIEERILRNYSDKKIIIDVEGEAVGQVNGLSVIETGGYSFGKPCRITASTYMGKDGIINIEREAELSGNIHSKSVMIISGYLGNKYARDIPLSLTAHICFEQTYGFIDGDSASTAELYTILSSLSGIPLKQCIAVTGSVNQKGEVQPVGGINEKIEGFYKVCTFEGLNNRHGVIIPYHNIDDILLDDNIMKDIKNGRFHIYAIKDVEDGIEILTGMKPGVRDSSGKFESGTFNYYVDRQLKKFINNYKNLDSTGMGEK